MVVTEALLLSSSTTNIAICYVTYKLISYVNTSIFSHGGDAYKNLSFPKEAQNEMSVHAVPDAVSRYTYSWLLTAF